MVKNLSFQHLLPCFAYVQKGYAFGCIGLCVYVSVYKCGKKVNLFTAYAVQKHPACVYYYITGSWNTSKVVFYISELYRC